MIKKHKDKNILLIFTFVIIIIIGINVIFKESYSKKEVSLSTIISERFSSFDNIGCYLTDQDELFLFLDNNEFFWFKSYNNLNKDYYVGTYNYKSGESALEELGYTNEEIKEEYGSNIDISKIYSFNIIPTMSNNLSESVYPSDSWWFIIIHQDNKKATAINQTLGVKYNVTKINKEL